MEQFMEKQLI